MRPWTLAPLLLAASAAGCFLEGEERSFPDESDEVVRMHVNAYAAVEGAPRTATVESSGLGEDGQERAFHGTLRIRLELQRNGTTEPTYAPVEEWAFGVDADDFGTPTVPFHRFIIPADAFTEDGTYRVKVGARIGGRDVPEGSALFAYAAREAPRAGDEAATAPGAAGPQDAADVDGSSGG